MIKDENSDPTDIDIIKKMMEVYDINVTEVPRLLFAETSRIMIDERGPIVTIEPNKLSLFETQAEEMTRIQKLKFDGYGDWELNATMIHSAYFASRQEVDEFLAPEFTIDRKNTIEEKRDKISIEEIGTMDGMKCFFLNLEYYLANWEELEKDLGRSVEKSRENRSGMEAAK
jgi:hypothetical protein